MIFICQILENSLIVIKSAAINSPKGNFLACENLPLSPDTDETELADKLGGILKRLEYNNNQFILALPHKFAASRYLKVPTQIPQEIEKIVALQASTFLPSTFKELITGFLVISTEKNGYSGVNLVIVQKDVIERYVRIFNKLEVKNFKITLSSLGLANLCNLIKPETDTAVMIIEVELPRVELAVSTEQGLIFSRAFNILKQEGDWLRSFVEEVNKTKEAYLKEIPGKELSKILIVGPAQNYKMYESLSGKFDLPVGVIPYWERISCTPDFKKSIQGSSDSLAGIIGLGLKEVPESINLIPHDLKAIVRNIYARKEIIRIAMFIAAITLVLGLAAYKNLENKTRYLEAVTLELKKIEKDALKLEEFEKNFEFMKSHLMKKPASIDIIYGVYQALPQSLSLNSLGYEEAKQVVLRGQTPDLSSVFLFVSQLEKAPVFKDFQVKVKYVSKKKTQSGEIVDFEIVCSRQD